VENKEEGPRGGKPKFWSGVDKGKCKGKVQVGEKERRGMNGGKGRRRMDFLR